MPDRMCIGCRKKVSAGQMFRMAVSAEGEVAAELKSQLPGRGAHCCFDRSCLQRALKPGVLAHVFRRAVKAPEEDVIAAQILAALEKKLKGLLSAGFRKGAVVAGREAALREAGSGKAGRWFFSSDLSPNSRKEVEGKVSDPILLPLGMDAVGLAGGRKPAGVLYVVDLPLADAIAASVVQWNALRIA